VVGRGSRIALCLSGEPGVEQTSIWLCRHAGRAVWGGDRIGVGHAFWRRFQGALYWERNPGLKPWAKFYRPCGAELGTLRVLGMWDAEIRMLGPANGMIVGCGLNRLTTHR
jgi:hypothetical protein